MPNAFVEGARKQSERVRLKPVPLPPETPAGEGPGPGEIGFLGLPAVEPQQPDPNPVSGTPLTDRIRSDFEPSGNTEFREPPIRKRLVVGGPPSTDVGDAAIEESQQDPAAIEIIQELQAKLRRSRGRRLLR